MAMQRRLLFNILYIFSVLAACVSCDKHEEDVRTVWTEYRAHFVDVTKTSLDSDSGQVTWGEDDAISILYGEQNSKFVSYLPGGEKYTAFKGEIEIYASESDNVFAVYPYRDDTARLGDSIVVSLNNEQEAVEATYDPNAMISLAQCKSIENDLQFQHLCGGLRFKVKTESIVEIEFKGNNNEVLAGTVEVSFDNGVPYVSKVISPETTVRLLCPEGFDTDKWYYLTMLPAELTEGFSITLYDENTYQTYYSSRKTTVKSSVFGQISKLDEGLEFDDDWVHNSFVHKSMMLVVPDCYDNGVIIGGPGIIRWDMESFCNKAKLETQYMLESARVFANGPEPTEGIDELKEVFGLESLPFCTVDYRFSSVNFSMLDFNGIHKETARLYGTSSGIGINSRITDNKLTVDASLYFKKTGSYKVVVMLTEDRASYKYYYVDGTIRTLNNQSDVSRAVASSIIGDDVTVDKINSIKYRSYTIDIPDDVENSNLRVLVYVLRKYGERVVIRDGNYGEWYVDNAFSATAGKNSVLPTVKYIDFDIEPLKNYGIL